MLALLIAAVLDPRFAIPIGATLAGHPEWAPELERICARESNLRPIGVHPEDAGRSLAVWREAVRVGNVDPTCQPHEHHAWSTRGIAGVMAGFTLHHVGVPCLPPWVLDLPIVNAYAATRRAHDRRCGQVLACRRWRDV
jgi:hypothetical protein